MVVASQVARDSGLNFGKKTSLIQNLRGDSFSASGDAAVFWLGKTISSLVRFQQAGIIFLGFWVRSQKPPGFFGGFLGS